MARNSCYLPDVPQSVVEKTQIKERWITLKVGGAGARGFQTSAHSLQQRHEDGSPFGVIKGARLAESESTQ